MIVRLVGDRADRVVVALSGLWTFGPPSSWLTVHDFSTGRRGNEFPTPPDGSAVIALAADGATLAMVAEGPSIRLIDLASGRTRAIALGTSRKDGEIGGVDFSPDGAALAVAIEANPVLLLNVVSGKEQGRIGIDNRSRPGILKFSPNGRVLAVAGEDASGGATSVRLVEIATGREQVRLVHRADISALAFSPDGTILATGTEDSLEDRDFAVRLWNVADGRKRAEVPGHRNSVTGLSFSADGARLVSSSLDGTALIWDVPSLLRSPPKAPPD